MPKSLSDTIGLYARCSTADQDPEVQLAELRAYAERRGCAAIEFVDAATSGRSTSRPELDEMRQAALRREITAVVVVRLDRLARSLVHMVRLGEELHQVGVDLVSLNESIDTSTSTGRALFGMCGVFAQLEADLIRERTVAGVAAARTRGKVPGRPPAIDRRTLDRVRRLRGAGDSIRVIADKLDLSRSVVGRAAKQLA